MAVINQAALATSDRGAAKAPRAAASLPDASAPPWYRSTLGIALAGSALMWAAQPPLDWWLLGWLAPVPWIWLALRPEMPGRRPYRSLWLAGFVFWLSAMQFVRLPYWATAIGWVALAVYCGFYAPVFVGLVRIAVHRWRVSAIIAAPIVWMALELVRAHLFSGFTLGHLAHTQYRWVEVIQIADVVGVHGVAAVVVCVGACVARMLPDAAGRWSLWPLAPLAAVLMATLGYGELRMESGASRPGPTIALIQGSIDTVVAPDREHSRRAQQQYFDLTFKATRRAEHLDLIVWPETMYREPLLTYSDDAAPPEGEDWIVEDLHRSAEAHRAAIGQLARAVDTPLLLGIEMYHYRRRTLDCYNSAVYVGRDGEIRARYDKMHPVVFGEYLPLGDWLPWLYDLTPLSKGLTSGTRCTPIQLGDATLAPSICYETLLPHVIRRQLCQVRATGCEPDVLVNLTNDGWFWGSSELDMHLACASFRAVESRKPVLVAANTGFSAWFDADGRMLAKGPRRATDVIVAAVELDDRESPYLAYGDWAAEICLGISTLLAFSAVPGALRRRYRRS